MSKTDQEPDQHQYRGMNGFEYGEWRKEQQAKGLWRKGLRLADSDIEVQALQNGWAGELYRIKGSVFTLPKGEPIRRWMRVLYPGQKPDEAKKVADSEPDTMSGRTRAASRASL